MILDDATSLQSAFANDQFGRNITEKTSVIAAENDAIFAINGDYYGFRDDGIIIRNGVIYRDQPARTGLAFFLDGSMAIYDETETSAEKLLAEGVWNTLSFGPALLIDSAIPRALPAWKWIPILATILSRVTSRAPVWGSWIKITLSLSWWMVAAKDTAGASL